MKIKNTDSEYNIIKKEISGKTKVIGAITAFALLITLTGCMETEKKDISKPSLSDIGVTNEEYYYYYSNQYNKAYESLNEEDFDNGFQKVYETSNIIIDGKEYRLIDIYIAKLADESIHIKIAGENKDMITNEELKANKTISVSLRNSTIFYKLYEDGLIKIENDVIKIDSITLMKYAENWDGLEHTEIMELKADAIASENYQKKYGR